MPRGIPNAKRDETGMRYTTFTVPLSFNPKHASSNYLKSDSQTLWTRNAAKRGKAPVDTPQETRRGSQVIVIHPGSRNIRIGRASDVNPLSIPCVVARKSRTPVQPTERVQLVSHPRKPSSSGEPVSGDDPFEANLSAITVSLRDRMRFYKLRITPNATKIASTFNEQFQPERISEHNDYEQEWVDGSKTDATLVGEQALRLADPVAGNYLVKWPIYGSNFNTRDYASLQAALSDLELLISHTLSDRFDIAQSEYGNYSVMLVIPDFYDRAYVREMANLLLNTMGFKQLCAQQESLGATFGAGISNACVVDIGATQTNIACVDEGLVLPDTRLVLNMGGDDVTEFLYVLLERIKFPYREINLNNSYDWNVMEDLKARLCSLADSDVALNLYDFNVRRPNKLTEKYGLRAYDEIIAAPMCFFEPRVIQFDSKRKGFYTLGQNVTEDIIGQQDSTLAMVLSTAHLVPAPPPAETLQTVIDLDQPSGETSELSTLPATRANSVQTLAVSSPRKPEYEGQLMDADTTMADPPSEAPIEVIDVEDESKPQAPVPPQHQQQQQPAQVNNSNSQSNSNSATGNQGFDFDVCFEASKLPLDVAIFNSARAAGGEEKIRKYLQAVLVIGGTALIPGMAHALESRLQAIATPLVPNMEKVQIIPPPKEVDPRVLAWKGAAVLAKMDSVSELWVTQSDWDIFGMRGLKERCFYL